MPPKENYEVIKQNVEQLRDWVKDHEGHLDRLRDVTSRQDERIKAIWTTLEQHYEIMEKHQAAIEGISAEAKASLGKNLIWIIGALSGILALYHFVINAN